MCACLLVDVCVERLPAPQAVSNAEDHLLAAFTELVMKLNETMVKPLIMRLVAWVAGDGASANGSVDTAAADRVELAVAARTTVLFRFTDRLADTLKVRGGDRCSRCGLAARG